MEWIIWALIVVLGGLGLVLPTIDYIKETKVSPYLTLLGTATALVLVLLLTFSRRSGILSPHTSL